VKKYRLDSDVNQSIVNGILQGYKNYLDERKEKSIEMNISTAYAWVKGNHIDDQTAEECKSLNIHFKKAKAGYTWGYLQFNIDQSRKSMFIIKNGQYFNQKNFVRRKGVTSQAKSDEDESSYLKRLSKINEKVVFPEEPSIFTKEQEKQITILDDHTLKELEKSEAKALAEEYDQFLIVTYEINEFFAIEKIRLLMPNPGNHIAYEIEDLSEYIGTSTVSFDDVDFDILNDDDFDTQETPAAEYGIVTQEELFKIDEE